MAAFVLALPLGSIEDYMKLPSKNASGFELVGCIGSAWANATLSKRVCDYHSRTATCSTMRMHDFDWDPNTITYLSIKRCVGAQAGTNVTGGCGPSPKNYWQCRGSGGAFRVLARFNLPPFLIAESCDKNPQCVGFVVNAVGSVGSLLTPTVDATNSYNLKVQPSPPVKALPPCMLRAVPPPPPAPCCPGFVKLAFGFPAPATATTPAALFPGAESVAFGRCAGEVTPAGLKPMPTNPCQNLSCIALPPRHESLSTPADVGLHPIPDQPTGFLSFTMDAGAMTALCTQRPNLCTHFVSHDAKDWRYRTWSAYTPMATPNMSTYVRTTAVIGRAGCSRTVEGDCGGTFLECAGRNSSQPLIKMETYDLPASVLYQACIIKKCDLFVSRDDGSGGTLYQFVVGNGRNVTAYFLLDHAAAS